ncbi:MAG: class I SAM-dependent methyltransferase [Cyanobacteria bacterium J06554_1]
MNKDLFNRRIQCPVCSSKKFTEVYHCKFSEKGIQTYLINAYGPGETINFQYLENYKYSLIQCGNCDLIFQEYIPKSNFMVELYDSWIDPEQALRQQQNYKVSYYSTYSQDILQILAYLSKPPATLKVLDFGMGWGRWALMAKAFGCEVYGVELSEQRINYAKTNGIKSIGWNDIPNYKFDFINTDQVFEHLSEPVHVLTQLKQSLQSNGIIKICVPNSFGIRYRLMHMDWTAPKGSLKSLNPVAPLEHINCFYRKSMLNLAQRLDLLEVKIPISIQYQYMTVWDSPKKALRNLLMPIYRNIFGLQNYYLFQKKPL